MCIHLNELEKYNNGSGHSPSFPCFKKALHKSEAARLLGVTPKTLSNWINKRYITELLKLDYHPQQKILSPKILNFLQQKLDLQPE